MVHEKSKHLLAEVYRGRLDADLGDTAAFSDVYTMKRMSKDKPGKAATPTGPFEFVSESKMDYANFKDRPEFSAEHGGENISRPGTPSTILSRDPRGRSTSRDSALTMSDEPGTHYPAGYHQTPSNLREYSPSPGPVSRIESNGSTPYEIPAQTNLLSGAAPMGQQQTPGGYTPFTPSRDGQQDYFRR